MLDGKQIAVFVGFHAVRHVLGDPVTVAGGARLRLLVAGHLPSMTAGDPPRQENGTTGRPLRHTPATGPVVLAGSQCTHGVVQPGGAGAGPPGG
ncbi:hypothetical protein GCM10010277_80380 [Streptomyces longisporoflavus]|nr:hypothetical protein GCM10010277_80380 [Streptomyces longisporoflavus]